MSISEAKVATPSKPAARPSNRPTDGLNNEASASRPAPSSDDADHEEGDLPPEEGGFALSGLFLAVPSWMVSLLFHVMLLMLLALITFAADELNQELFQTADVDTDEVEELEEFEFENQEIEITETTFEAASIDDAGMSNFGDITSPETSLNSDEAAHENTEAVNIGQLFGKEGIGMSEAGTGAGSTTFFGVRTEGDHFMYVVDNSNSMDQGKFENAVHELVKSVDQLNEKSFFYVLFYSDDAYPLFYPQSVSRWVRATEENKLKLQQWLPTVHRCLKTCGEGAMAHAMSLRPDVLYLLGDGAFTDNAVSKTLALEGSVDAKIHTLGFNMRAKDAASFEQIANAFGGSFRDVSVAPEMKAVAARTKRPKNRSPNGVWGLKLGKRK